MSDLLDFFEEKDKKNNHRGNNHVKTPAGSKTKTKPSGSKSSESKSKTVNNISPISYSGALKKNLAIPEKTETEKATAASSGINPSVLSTSSESLEDNEHKRQIVHSTSSSSSFNKNKSCRQSPTFGDAAKFLTTDNKKNIEHSTPNEFNATFPRGISTFAKKAGLSIKTEWKTPGLKEIFLKKHESFNGLPDEEKKSAIQNFTTRGSINKKDWEMYCLLMLIEHKITQDEYLTWINFQENPFRREEARFTLNRMHGFA